MRISVVLATYQRRHLVFGAIESALHQTRAADEVIVVDDGSTDGTADAVRAQYGERVRLVCQPNRGLSGAWNAAVAVATGELLAFLDDDDRWRPHHLATIEALATRHTRAVLVSTCRDGAFGEERPDDAVCLDFTERLLLGTEWVGAPTGVGVRREAYLAVGGCDERLRSTDDLDLYLQLSLLGPMALIRGRTFERLEHAGSLYREGIRTGRHFTERRAIASKVLLKLEQSTRSDAGALRRAAGARLALEDALVSLAAGGPTRTLRPALADVCRLAPELRAQPTSIARALPNAVPGWGRPSRRLRTIAALLRAWPEHSGRGYVRLVRACARAARTVSDLDVDAGRPVIIE